MHVGTGPLPPREYRRRFRNEDISWVAMRYMVEIGLMTLGEFHRLAALGPIFARDAELSNKQHA